MARIGQNFPTKKKGFKTVVSEKFGRVLALLLTATYILLASVQFPKSHMIRQAQNNNQKNSCKCMASRLGQLTVVGNKFKNGAENWGEFFFYNKRAILNLVLQTSQHAAITFQIMV